MKRISRLAAAMLTTLMLFLSLPAFSLAEPAARTAPGTAEYNFYDVLCGMFFLEREDENGVKNGTKMFGDSYDMSDPGTWSYGEEGDTIGFAFEEIDGELRLTGVICVERDLVGCLDLTGCSELREVSCCENRIDTVLLSGCSKLERLNVHQNNGLTALDVSECPKLTWLECYWCSITELDLTGCSELCFLDMEGCHVGELDVSNFPELWYLMCENCGLSELDVSNNPKLRFLHCGVNGISELDLSNNGRLISLNCDLTAITELDVSGCPMLEQLQCVYGKLKGVDLRQNESLVLDEVYAEGRGAVGVNVSEDWMNTMFVDAYPDAGETFLGWYDEAGELVSTDQRLYFTEDDGTVFIARFTGGEVGPVPEIPGDVNGDGEVDSADSLLVMRGVMGLVELSPEQLAASDVNGDGRVTLIDALLILRTALGLWTLE